MPIQTAHFPDISHYEPKIDFHALANSGVPLVITKATENGSYTDPTYTDFAKRIRSVPPLILGAYVFEDVGNEAVQVSHFLSTAHLQKGDLQPILDAEAAGLTKQQTFDTLHDFEHRGFRPILYCNRSFFQDVLGSPTQWWLWLAAYTDTLPTLAPGVKLFAHQYSDHAIFAGVSKPCDGNHLYVPVADLKTKFCI